ncbi:unnamed protein product, partial [marine sediment metagenome]
GFDTGFWGKPHILKLQKDAKFLFIYLWTNDHCNQAGLYYIAPETIAFFTKLDEADLPSLFEEIKQKVKWYPEENLVWVKNFVKRQSKSSKFLAAVAKSLTAIHHDAAIQELLTYNLKRYGIEIPYKYYMDRVFSPSAAEPSERAEPLHNSSGKGNEPSSKTKDILDPKLGAIAECFEENIGMLTPALFERLKLIADTYPEGWFEKAVEEACGYGKRNLGYIEKILERWSKEGLSPSKTKRTDKPDKDDLDKYIKGKYGHMVRR